MSDERIEIDMPRGSDAEARMLGTDGGDVARVVAECARLLERVYGEDQLPRLDAEHRGLVARIAGEISGKAGNAIEEAVLWGMVANTAVATMWGVVDWANGQAEILDITEGSDD